MLFLCVRNKSSPFPPILPKGVNRVRNPQQASLLNTTSVFSNKSFLKAVSQVNYVGRGRGATGEDDTPKYKFRVRELYPHKLFL